MMESFVEDYAFFAIFGFAILMVAIKFFGYSYFAFTNGYSLHEFMFGREEELSFVADDGLAHDSGIPEFELTKMLDFMMKHNMVSADYDWIKISSEAFEDWDDDFLSLVLGIDEYVAGLASASSEMTSANVRAALPGMCEIPFKLEETAENYKEVLEDLISISGGALPIEGLQVVHVPVGDDQEDDYYEACVVTFQIGQEQFEWEYETEKNYGKWLHTDMYYRFGELLRRQNSGLCYAFLGHDQSAHAFLIHEAEFDEFSNLMGEYGSCLEVLSSKTVIGPLSSREQGSEYWNGHF